MATVDNLQIQIEANAVRANDAIDKLVGKLDRLSTSLGKINGSSLTGLANGVQRLGNAMQTMNTIKTADFTRLARNLQNIGNINVSALNSAASSMSHLTRAFNGLGTVSQNAIEIGNLAKNISKLGNKGIQNAITNIPQLATALKGLMQTLSTAPTVSRSVIQMTNALANLASSGSRVGSASNSLISGLTRTGSSMSKTTKKTLSLASAFGKFYASYWVVVRALKGLWSSIESSMDYVEVLNYFNAAFGQVADSAVSQWEDAGYESAEAYYNSFSERAQELTTKMTGFNITESGMLKSDTGKSLGINPSQLMQYQAMFAQMSNSMGITAETSLKLSTALTEIGADLASVKNMDFDKVWTDMASGLAGMSRTLDKYGVNIRNVNLQQKLSELGIDANITALNQNDKALLRTIILLDSTRYAWGDLADTINQPANQLRMLKSNFSNLARTIGNIFLPIVAKVLPYVNALVVALQKLAEFIVNLLGFEDFDWGGSSGIGGVDLGDIVDDTEDLAGGLDDAASAAKELKGQLQGIDELNVLSTSDTSGSGGSSGSGGISSGLLDSALDKILEEYQKTWDKAFDDMEKRYDSFAKHVAEAFKSGGLEGVGQYISDTLTSELNSIPWTKIYSVASSFGTGLASFLNGLISPQLFSALGGTIASSLNTALNFLNSFGKTFKWKNFGESISEGINNFFETTDLVLAADTINTWVSGLEDAFISAVKNLNYPKILEKVTEFLTELDLDVVMIAIGAIAWKYKGEELLLSKLGSILASEMSVGIGDLVISKGATLGISVATAIVGFKIGNALYENIPTVQQIADSLVEWIFKDGKEIAVAKTISVALTGLTISLSTAGIISVIKTAITGAITTASAEASLAGTGVGAVILGKIGTAITTATGALSTLGSTIVGGIGTALSNVGTFLTSGVSTVFAGGAASIAAGLFAAIGAAIGGWNIGKLIYEKFSEQIDSIVFAIGDFFTKTIPEALSKAGNAILDFTANIKGEVDETFTSTKEKFLELKDQTVQKLIEAKEKVAGKFDEWKGKFDDFKTNTAQKLIETKEAVSGKLKEWKTNFDNFKSDTAQKLIETKEKVNGEFSQWKDKFDDFKNNTAEKVIETKEAVSGKFDEWKTNFDNFVGNTISKVVAAKEDAGSTFSTWKNEFDNFKDDYVVKTALAIGNFDNNAREIKDWFDEKTNDTKNLLAKGVAEGKEKIESIKGVWDEIKEKTKKLVAKGSQTGQSALEGIKKVWSTIKEKTKKLKIEGSQTGKKTLSSVKRVWDGITAGTKEIKTKFSGIKSGLLEKVSNAWNSIQEKAKELSVVFNDNFTAPLKRAWNAIARSINTFVDKIPYVGSKIADVPTFAGYATGGFPEDGWFRASRGEIMGKFDNGQSVVASNMQITQGISDAVYRGNQALLSVMQEELSTTRQQNEILMGILEKETGISYKDVFKAAQKGASEYTARTGNPAFI